jgi:hypothetical protein
MQARLDPRKAAPDATKAMSNLHAYVGKCGLDHKLIELIKLRASQIKAHLAVGAGCVTPWASLAKYSHRIDLYQGTRRELHLGLRSQFIEDCASLSCSLRWSGVAYAGAMAGLDRCQRARRSFGGKGHL